MEVGVFGVGVFDAGSDGDFVGDIVGEIGGAVGLVGEVGLVGLVDEVGGIAGAMVGVRLNVSRCSSFVSS